MTRYLFEKKMMDVYTRAVYNLFRQRLFESGAFRIKPCVEHETKYFVHRYNIEREFAWSRHEFQVVADEESGEYECECKLFDHTGRSIKNYHLPRCCIFVGNKEMSLAH